MASAEVEGGDGAVAAEVDVLLVDGRKLRVGLDAVERAVDLRGDGAGGLDVEDVALEAQWLEGPLEERGLRELGLRV